MSTSSTSISFMNFNVHFRLLHAKITTLAEQLEKDPNTSDRLQECAGILRQLAEQFPLRDVRALEEAIRKADGDELNILKWHLKLPGFLSGDQLADEVSAILQEVPDHQHHLLGV